MKVLLPAYPKAIFRIIFRPNSSSQPGTVSYTGSSLVFPDQGACFFIHNTNPAAPSTQGASGCRSIPCRAPSPASFYMRASRSIETRLLCCQGAHVGAACTVLNYAAFLLGNWNESQTGSFKQENKYSVSTTQPKFPGRKLASAANPSIMLSSIT